MAYQVAPPFVEIVQIHLFQIHDSFPFFSLIDPVRYIRSLYFRYQEFVLQRNSVV